MRHRLQGQMQTSYNTSDKTGGDSLGAYARAAARYDVLSRDAEAELTRAHAEGRDSKAASKLVTANLRLVMKIARGYARWSGQPVHDLIQEGNCGLIDATSKYDVTKGVRFTSYASWWIRAYMLRFIVSNARMVKIGTTTAQRKLFYGFQEARHQLEATGVEPTVKALAEYLQIGEADVEDARSWTTRAGETSLDAPRPLDDGETLVDQLRSDAEAPDEALERSELSKMIRASLEAFEKTLTGRDSEIFRDRFTADELVSRMDLSLKYKVTYARIRQVEERLACRLKQHLRATLPEEVVAVATLSQKYGVASRVERVERGGDGQL